MIYAGLGERQVNHLLSAVNLPSVHHKTLKTHEREAGHFIEEVASQSIEAALADERRLPCRRLSRSWFLALVTASCTIAGG